MKLYKTTSDSSDQDKGATRWAGSQAEASSQRAAMKKEKLPGVGTDEIDVPTDKKGLLAWLNINAVA